MKSSAVKHGIEKIKTAVVSDEPRKRLLFIFLNSALSLTSFIMTIVNWFTGEYLLLIMQCHHDPAAVAEEIRKAIAQTPLQYDGKEITVTVSAGVAVADRLSEKTVHDMIETADIAMYASKNNGKNQVTVLR